jgi:hypothetical protein
MQESAKYEVKSFRKCPRCGSPQLHLGSSTFPIWTRPEMRLTNKVSEIATITDLEKTTQSHF